VTSTSDTRTVRGAGTRGGWVGLVAFMVAATACGGAHTVRKPLAEAREASSDLPPHAVEIGYGMWSCERGYVLRHRKCVPEEELARVPRVEVFAPDEERLVDLEAPPRRRDPLTAMPGFEWTEADFPARPVVAYNFSLDPRNLATVIGEPTPYELPPGKTVYEAARHLGLGINQVAEAFPDLDFLHPPAGETLEFPTWWILPESDYQGLVINIPEMRIYYFPLGRPGTVITYPVGLGRDDWRTPIERFKVTDKAVDPPWLIPESIRAEHIRERNDPRTMIPGGDPENPLGHYRLRLNLPLYGIHGTNIPWGIGMQVTHGCVRLYPEDIERLFPMVRVGTAGQFVYQPVKLGERGGTIYIEVHPDIYQTNFDYVGETMRLLAARGWSKQVHWDLLEAAIAEKRATPTRISDGPVPLHSPRVEPVRAEGQKPTSSPRS
jgi:L,D-transpeptidase ErfK/SrfK